MVTGIAKSGVVGVIRGNRGAGKVLGLRADMDALPMSEQTNLPYASRAPNTMHACGHDGHTATLLAAAKYLAETRDFTGTVVLISQPAEEGGGGARVMIEEGLLDRFAIDEVYGMHNQPGLAVGSFAIRPGPMLASGDRFMVSLSGQGGHAAYPHLTQDLLLTGAHLVTVLQSIASRFIDPSAPVVVSVTYFNAGNPAALNILAASVEIGGSIRTITPEIPKSVEILFRDIVNSTAKLFDAVAKIDWRPGYPVTVNTLQKTRLAAAAAISIAGADKVDVDWPRTMGSEDFAYMLEKRRGALMWLGNGDSAGLHHPAYNFNDDAIIHGMQYWTALVEQRLARQ